MDLGFRGEVVDFYDRYRRSYPPAIIDALVRVLELTTSDIVVDLGCGTGQMTFPIARRVRAVIGVDPEPDMLEQARRAATEHGLTNVTWMMGADTDMPALRQLLGDRTIGAVTIGQALHWMSHDELFRVLNPLLRHGGGVAVVTNGVPLWLQDTAWSKALRAWLEKWLGSPLTSTCGTDEASQARYRDSLMAAGFDVSQATFNYADELDLDQIVGGVYSALSVDQLPALDQRPRLAEQVRRALQEHAPYNEHIRVNMLIGRIA